MIKNNKLNKVQIVRNEKKTGKIEVMTDPRQVAESMMKDFGVSNMIASRQALHVCFGDIYQNTNVIYFLHDHTADSRQFYFDFKDQELNIIGVFDRFDWGKKNESPKKPKKEKNNGIAKRAAVRFEVGIEGAGAMDHCDTFEKAKQSAALMLKDGVTEGYIEDTYYKKRKPRKWTVKICTGEAHSNAFIDHCGVCMPDWGIVVREIKPAIEEAG